MESTAKRARPAQQDPPKAKLKPRQCRYCKARFTPRRPQDADQRFCSPTHRKAFHKYGGLPFDKLLDRMRKEVRAMIRAELAGQQAAAVFGGAPLDIPAAVRVIVRDELAALLAPLFSGAALPPLSTARP